jgi:TolB protein
MALTPRVLDMLIVLVERDGEVVSKEALMSSLWADSFVEEGNISRTVSTLRKAIGTQANGSDFIETVPKIGYRFIAPVQKAVANVPEPVLTQTDLSNRKYRLLAAGLVLVALVGMYWFVFRTSASRAGSDGLTNVTSNLADDDLPTWSPDGSKIAFTSNRGGMADIYVMNSDGSDTRRLTFTPGREGASTWSPDGKKIAFDSERDGNTEIYTVDVDGTNETRLTINPTADAGPVSFSPDGKRIAFARNGTGGVAVFNFDIYTMNADGSDVKQLTTDPGFDAEPMWSPDGSRILFITDRLTNFEIFSINPDGSGEMNISNSPANDGPVGFTPDGQQFFWRSDTTDKLLLNQIYVVNLDGTNRRQITSFADKTYRVAYSTQAQKFAFTSKKEGNFEIYTMDAIVPAS